MAGASRDQGPSVPAVSMGPSWPIFPELQEATDHQAQLDIQDETAQEDLSSEPFCTIFPCACIINKKTFKVNRGNKYIVGLRIFILPF